MTEARKRHPAQASRIAAAGIGTVTMFGLVAAMGIARQAATASQPAPPAPVEIPSQIVVDLGTPAGAAVPTASSPVAVAPVVAAPVVLSAKPVVQPAAPGPATGATHGSR